MSKISELSDGGALQSTDYLIAVRSGGNVKVQLSELPSGIGAGGNIVFGDNEKAIFGAGSDLQIYHSGTHSFISDQGTGNMLVLADNFEVNSASNTANKITAATGGAVTLFHNNAAKLATTGSGINVTGTVTADGLTVNKGADGADIVSLTGASAGRYLKVQSFTNSGSAGAGYDFNATSGQGAIRLSTANLPRLFVGDNGDISFYEDTGTTPKFFWDASAETLTVGGDDSATSSGLKSLILGEYADSGSGVVLRASSASAINFEDSNASTAGRLYYNHTSDYMSFNTAGNERMRITSSGNVNIYGTDNRPLAITSFDTVSTGAGWDLDATSSNGVVTVSTGGSERMRIDSSGRLLVGTTSNYGGEALQINANSVGATVYTAYISNTNTSTSAYNVMRWAQGAAGSATGMIGTGGSATGNVAFRNSFVVGTQSSSPLVFATGDAERARLDASGNLLVGTTSEATWTTTAGFRTRPSGSTTITRSAAPVLYANRLTSDGAIQEFLKDGTTVGSIGVTSARLTIGSGDTGLRFVGDADQITPWNTSTNSASDNLLDLGNTNNRFKDLYLSGTANAGGLTVDGVVQISNAAPTLQFTDTDNNYDATIQGLSGSLVLTADSGAEFGTESIQFKTGGGERMRIDSSGNVLVGTTTQYTSSAHIVTNTATATYGICIRDTGQTTGAINFENASGTQVGNITITASATTYNTSSDARLKENIADAEDASELIDAIKVRSFDWKADGFHQRYGMVAQELLEVAPEAVSQGATEEDMMGVDYSKLVPMLVKEIQSLRARVAQLEGA